MANLNLIFDGNYLFYKTLHVLKKKGVKFPSTDNDKKNLINKLATDFTFLIRQFYKPNRIIFCIDSRSWRKDIHIEENDGYKSKRDYSDEIDWDLFFEICNEFVEILKSKGILISKIERAEGDDLVYLWSQYLLQNKENSIIISGDGDMKQTVRINEDEDNFIALYNPNSTSRKLYMAEGSLDWVENTKKKDGEDDNDLFNLDYLLSTERDLIKNVLENVPAEEIKVNEFLIEKIIHGDSGDDVPGIYTWEDVVKTGKNKGKTRINRLTISKTAKIIDYIKKHDKKLEKISDLFDNVDLITESLKSITKQKDISEDYITKQIKRNIKLMVLNQKIIPKDIIETFKAEFKIQMNYATLGDNKYNKQFILEDTEYEESSAWSFDMFSKLK